MHLQRWWAVVLLALAGAPLAQAVGGGGFKAPSNNNKGRVGRKTCNGDITWYEFAVASLVYVHSSLAPYKKKRSQAARCVETRR
jgi:hypothetical protein